MPLAGIEPVYTIEEAAYLLAVQPATIRLWENHNLLSPSGRRFTRRSYNSRDLKKLHFIRELLGRGLSITYVSNYVRLYSCWFRNDCPKCMNRPDRAGCAKLCWKEPGTYCQIPLGHQDPCKTCEFGPETHRKVIPLARR
jgi:DNA-binding transcriptional MerR regulator